MSGLAVAGSGARADGLTELELRLFVVADGLEVKLNRGRRAI